MTSAALTDIYNFLEVSDSLGTAGQPTEAQFDSVKEAGYEVVINLAMPNSEHALPDEAQLVSDKGLTYIAIPVEWTAPTEADLNQFFEAMDRHQQQKRFVHCIANMRVSAFVFLYRVIRQGVAVNDAKQTLNQIWQPEAVWADFVGQMLAKHNVRD